MDQPDKGCDKNQPVQCRILHWFLYDLRIIGAYNPSWGSQWTVSKVFCDIIDIIE